MRKCTCSELLFDTFEMIAKLVFNLCVGVIIAVDYLHVVEIKCHNFTTVHPEVSPADIIVLVIPGFVNLHL